MQKFTRIAPSQTLQESLALILDNDATAISQHSGTAFPTSDLVVGMPCVRTDQMKVYVLKQIDPAVVWHEVANLDATNWNSVTQGPDSGMNADMVDGIHASATAQANKLLALDDDAKLPASITGNAETVKNYSPSTEVNGLAINSGALNKSLNADMVDGYHASNASGAIPLSNGAVNEELNADMLDGFHASAFIRTIAGMEPDANGNVQIDLSSSVPVTGGTMSGPLTATKFTATGNEMVIAGVSPTLTMQDTNSSTRKLHVNDGLMGFLKTDGSWSMYADNAGQIHSATYGWLHSYFFNVISNPAVANCTGTGNISEQIRYSLVDGGGTLTLRALYHKTNCNCNCNCSTDA